MTSKWWEKFFYRDSTTFSSFWHHFDVVVRFFFYLGESRVWNFALKFVAGRENEFRPPIYRVSTRILFTRIFLSASEVCYAQFTGDECRRSQEALCARADRAKFQDAAASGRANSRLGRARPAPRRNLILSTINWPAIFSIILKTKKIPRLWE